MNGVFYLAMPVSGSNYDCLFRSISTNLYGYDINHRSIRSRTVNCMADNFINLLLIKLLKNIENIFSEKSNYNAIK